MQGEPNSYAPPHARQQIAVSEQVRDDAAYIRQAAAWVTDQVEIIKSLRNTVDTDERPAVDPVVRGLLDHMPRTGAVWPEAERKQWLALLEGSFRLIYKDAATASGPP
jgi:hypothetical protein